MGRLRDGLANLAAGASSSEVRHPEPRNVLNEGPEFQPG